MKNVLLIVILIVTLNLSAKNGVDSVIVSGNVVETINGVEKPLSFVSVYCEGTTSSTFTDENGNYNLLLKKQKIQNIRISHKGYNTVEIKIKNNMLKSTNKINFKKIQLFTISCVYTEVSKVGTKKTTKRCYLF